MVIRITILLLIVIILLVVWRNKKVYESFIDQYKEDITLPIIAPLAFAMIDKLKLYRRLPKLINAIHQKMIILRGSKLSGDYTKIYLAKIITLLTVMLLFTMVLVEVSDGGNINLIYGLILMVVVSVFLVKDLDKKVKQRKDSIIIELPEFVNKIILLVNAGETVQGAMKKSVDQQKNRVLESPLYFELNEAVNKMTANTSFQEVMKDLNYRCGIQEVSIFTTTVMMNYRKGGSLLVQSLNELSVSLWDKRKTVTRIKGEEASSKLVFPIIFIFAAVLLVVIYPAIASF
ncbi:MULTISPECIES: type II secretion system F family protein [Gracilibacillus]|uniref:type II secretion system F family protein n=1 Tax=Gracilibacillus TaxID=74385 RepID=UPI000826FC29|nr:MULTISPECIES: type II secretion system F family protein [Gracilibacillus]